MTGDRALESAPEPVAASHRKAGTESREGGDRQIRRTANLPPSRAAGDSDGKIISIGRDCQQRWSQERGREREMGEQS